MSITNRRRRAITAEEFLYYPSGGKRDELVRGEVEMNPDPGPRHALVAVNLLMQLSSYVRQHELGECFDAAGFKLPNLPHTVRGPDVSFVRADRLPPTGAPEQYLELAPDLAVEVLSPTNRPGKMKEKIDDYLVAGVRLIWIVDPKRRTVTFIRPGTARRLLTESDALDGEDVVPGFQCPISVVFKGAAR